MKKLSKPVRLPTDLYAKLLALACLKSRATGRRYSLTEALADSVKDHIDREISRLERGAAK